MQVKCTKKVSPHCQVIIERDYNFSNATCFQCKNEMIRLLRESPKNILMENRKQYLENKRLRDEEYDIFDISKKVSMWQSYF